MKSAFEADLIEALADLEAGLPLEEILSRYPQQAEQLRPILQTGAQLSTLPVAHSLSAQAASRDAFLRQATALRHQEHRVVAPLSLWRRLALSLASLAVVVMILGGVVAGAAQEALPGQALYPVKRTLEEVRLSLASDPAGQEALQAQFRAERQEEINALLAAGLEGTVECEGALQALAADSWIIDDLEVAIGSTTTISGTPQIGSTVRGTCQVTGGQVVGKMLRVETQRHPAPSPSATPTATATPTASATPTKTAPSGPLEGNTTIQPEEMEEAELEGGDDDGGHEEADSENENAGNDDEPESGDDEAERDDDEVEPDDDDEEPDDKVEQEEDSESESEPDDDPDDD